MGIKNVVEPLGEYSLKVTECLGALLNLFTGIVLIFTATTLANRSQRKDKKYVRFRLMRKA